MRVFKEEQRFTQWWLILICLISGIGILLRLLSIEDISENLSIGKLIGPIVGLLVCVGILFVKLHTRIDKFGIQVWFSPFSFTKKAFSWKDLETAHTRKYNAFSEFGGWGIRVFRKHKAYNVKGDKGIQLKTKNGKYFLVGTQQLKNADRVINRYFNTQE